MAADRYADLAAAGRYRDQLATWADRAEANAADPESYNRTNFVYTTTDSWTRRVADLGADIEAQDAHIAALRERLRRAD